MNALAATNIVGDTDDTALAAELFDALRAISFDGVGISRLAYGPEESLALDVLEAKAQELGLHTERDAGANLVVTLPGADPSLPFMACGSHLDSVPQGGNFDGAAGVIAGLAILASFKRDGFVPNRTIKLLCLRGEESARFGMAYMGSRALFGKLTINDLAITDAVGKSLGACMAEVGADVDRIARGEPLLDPANVFGWMELHIEQGPVLVARDLPIGIVTGIRGNVRHRTVKCIGEAGHSGAIPRWLRHDAVMASAELLTHLDHHWRTLLERGRDLVMTAGLFGTLPEEHAIARIPGEVHFSFEVRSQNSDTLEGFYDIFLSEARLVERERGVRFELDRRVDSAPAIMNAQWVERLKRAAETLRLPTEDIPSGAGHDAAVFANVGIPSAMVFVRNEHGSHNPHEAMRIDDMVAGVAVMREAMREALQ